MNRQSIIVIVLCCNFIGCAIFISPATYKKDRQEKNYLSHYVEATGVFSDIPDKNLMDELTLFNDPNYGDVHAIQSRLSFEYNLGEEYMMRVNKGLMLFPGIKVSYFSQFTIDVTTGWYQDPWDRRYHASLDPDYALEPYFGAEMRVPPKSNLPIFAKASIGIPFIHYEWDKHYDLQLDESYANWKRYYVDHSDVWSVGLSGKFSLEVYVIGISYSLRYTPIAIAGARTKYFMQGISLYFDFNGEKF
ncbi:MAG: hypothetical protein PHE24_03515 [Patescibacteria group bacterium]|nr:hypothetical protein [Patescibacteria group bacterium]